MKMKESGHDAMQAAMAESVTRHKKNKYSLPEELWLPLIVLAVGIVCLSTAGLSKAMGIREATRLLGNHAQIQYKHKPVITDRKYPVDLGIASWYNYTLGGQLWSLVHRTAASRDYPRYSCVKVTNLANSKSVVVYINDYGPEEWTGRAIDLSSFAFAQIASLNRGVANVKIETHACDN